MSLLPLIKSKCMKWEEVEKEKKIQVFLEADSKIYVCWYRKVCALHSLNSPQGCVNIFFTGF